MQLSLPVLQIFLGFTMVLQAKAESFRTLGNSIFALMRSILGDWNFEELENADLLWGPSFSSWYVTHHHDGAPPRHPPAGR
jgi:hypothetical protein